MYFVCQNKSLPTKKCIVLKIVYGIFLGAMVVALGESATGVFSTSDASWSAVQSAGYYTGDRMWRFPLWNYYSCLLQGMYFTILFVILNYLAGTVKLLYLCVVVFIRLFRFRSGQHWQR